MFSLLFLFVRFLLFFILFIVNLCMSTRYAGLCTRSTRYFRSRRSQCLVFSPCIVNLCMSTWYEGLLAQ